MKIKAKNPKIFTHPKKGVIISFLASHALNDDVSFDDVRKGIDMSLPDGVIHQIALDAGYKVEYL